MNDAVTSISANAFSGCTSLVSITISKSVVSLGDNAFSGTFYGADGKTVLKMSAYQLAGSTFKKSGDGFVRQENAIYFDSGGGTYVDRIFVMSDSKISAPADPTKTGYVFRHWTQDGNSAYDFPETMPATDLYLKAVWVIDEFTVTYKVDGLQIGESETYPSGTTVTLRDGYTKTGYTVTGWQSTDVELSDGKFSMPASDVVFNASSDADKCTVIFKVDGRKYVEQTPDYGTVLILPKDPVKDPTADIVYTFKGWKGYTEGMTVTDNMTFEAEFSDAVRTYAVEFVDYDGYRISTSMQAYGSVIVVPEQPSRPSDPKYTYTFSGWNGYSDGMTVTGDHTFTAEYGRSIRSYTVIFQDYDGREISSSTLEYDASITLPEQPSRAADALYSYTFSKWNGYFYRMKVSNDVMFTALYAAKSNTESTYVIGYQGLDAAVTRADLVMIGNSAQTDDSTKMEIHVGNAMVLFDSAAIKALHLEDAELSIELLSKDSLSNAMKNTIRNNPAYSITFGSNTSFGDGNVMVTLPYTLGDGKDPANLSVYCVRDDGSYDSIPCTYSENGVTFETDHFSTYAIIYPEPSEGFPIMIVVAIVAILAIAGVGVLFVKKRKC